MTTKNLQVACVMALIALMGLSLNAANVDVDDARLMASSFLKLHAPTAAGSLRAPAIADLKLAHSEPSSVDSKANAYYIFNIDGGGFIIVSGDDRASQVLGYSDEGRLNFNDMPENLTELLYSYKLQIEYLQAHPTLNVPKRLTSDNSVVIVEPMAISKWGQGPPFNMMCPLANTGKPCKVGCAGVQMSQICYYWKYPVTCGPLPAYYCSRLLITLEELPETTFDYDKMLLSYCHWDYDLGKEVQDTYTDEEAQEVAKLCRYVGHAAKMNYGATGSASDATKKLAGMKALGYNPNAKAIYKSSYTLEKWEQIMREELDAGRPIMYGAKNAAVQTSTSHAFIMDGYDSNGYFHINMGWYGHGDGWYLTSAIITTTLTGDYRDYNADQYMFINIEPTDYCRVLAMGIDAEDELFLLGSTFSPVATGVNIYTSHNDVDLTFTLTDQDGNCVATSDPINVVKSEFVQRSDVNGLITLPADLAPGTYNLQFNYIVDGEQIQVEAAQGQLTVTGKFAKFNGSFTIDDVTTVIDWLLRGKPNNVNLVIDDLTMLIDLLLK